MKTVLKHQEVCEEMHVTLILFVKDCNGPNPSVLIGLKKNGPVAGWVMPPGGHINNTDTGVIGAAVREGREEVNLRAEERKS